MKKVLALFLSLVMCLSLVACGNSEPTPPEVPEGLEFCVDVAWTNSYYYLELFPDGYAKYGEYATVIAPYYWRNLELVEEKDGIVCAQVEIYPEGKDGKTFTATFYSDPTVYNWAEIDGQKLYTTDDSNMTGNEPVGGETASPETTIPETTTPKPVYETIEITMDNWQEYFEFRHSDGQWIEDAFGDVTNYMGSNLFAVKKEYLDVVNPYTIDIAFSYSYSEEYRYCEADFENRTFAIGEIVPSEMIGGQYPKNVEGVSPAKAMTRTECGLWTYDCYKDNNMYMDVNGADMIRLYTSLDITRIQGTVEIQIN